jgi:homoserine dehydrogenase
MNLKMFETGFGIVSKQLHKQLLSLEEEKMKRTKINYTVTSKGFVRIVSIENVASKKEIAEKFSYEVAHNYFKTFSNYFRLTDNSISVNGKVLSVNSFLTQDNFKFVVRLMKDSGERLNSIYKNWLKHNTDTVVI